MKYIIIIFIVMQIVSCDLFSTRDPEEPSGFRNNFNSPTTPDVLFENFQSSFNDKTIENYTSNFIDSLYLHNTYKFVPAGDAATEFPRLLDWTLEDEKQYFTRLTSSVPTNQKLGLTLSFVEKTVYVDSAVYNYNYTITVNSNDENIPRFCAGSSQFTINIDERNFWVITKWLDISNNQDNSWSVLKGKLY
jgi:hypothetical protein